MLGKFKFIFHICAMKETLDFFIVKAVSYTHLTLPTT